MGTITKSTKQGGGTDLNDGESGVVADINTDMNSLFTLVNGNLDNNNIAAGAGIVASKLDLAGADIVNSQISSGAGIAPEKIDDQGTDATEFSATRDPGDSSSVTLPTDLTHDLQSLRHEILRGSLGLNTDLVDATNQATWFDGWARPGNLIRNTTPGTAFGNAAASTPDHWTAISGTITAPAMVVTEGEGNMVNVAASGAGDGISQNLDGLKASTRYLVVARVRPNTQICSLQTTGAASGTWDNLDIDSANGGAAFETLAGVIATDATPTDILVRVVAADATSDFDVAHVGVYEINDNPAPRTGYLAVRDTSTSAQAFGATAAVTGLSAAIEVPGPGYYIRVSSTINVASGSTAAEFRARIRENGSAVGTSESVSLKDSGDRGTATPKWIQTAPTPGTTYTYTVEGEEVGGTISAEVASGYGHEIIVELIHSGGGA